MSWITGTITLLDSRQSIRTILRKSEPFLDFGLRLLLPNSWAQVEVQCQDDAQGLTLAAVQ